jgi:hypothetical protein
MSRLFLLVPLAVFAATSLLVAPPASGQQDPATATAPCPPNAALAYWRAWNGRTPTIWESTFLESEMRRVDANWVPDSSVAAQLQAAQADIEALIKATQIEWCDWGVPLKEMGFEAGLPHLAKMRTAARVLMADSRRLSAGGDVHGAAERAAAMLRMSRHLRTDKLVYSVRTAQSIGVDFALAEMRRLAELKLLDDASRAVLIGALNEASGRDPWGMLPALQEEPVLIRDAIHRVCTGPDAAAMFFQKIAPGASKEDRARSGLEQLDEAGIQEAADRMSVAYLEVIANWDSPDAVQQIRSLQDQKKAGDYGAVGVLTGSDLPHMRVIVARAENIVKETIRVVNGETPVIPTPGLKPLPGR